MEIANLTADINIAKVNKELKSNVDFEILKAEKFWTKGSIRAEERGNFILFTVYLLSCYGFKEWKTILANDKAMSEFTKSYKKITQEEIATEELIAGLKDINALDKVIKEYAFSELLNSVAGEMSGKQKTLYSRDGFKEKGASRTITQYYNKRGFK